MLCHYWYFLETDSRYETGVCNSSHDINKGLSTKRYCKTEGADYHCMI